MSRSLILITPTRYSLTHLLQMPSLSGTFFRFPFSSLESCQYSQMFKQTDVLYFLLMTLTFTMKKKPLIIKVQKLYNWLTSKKLSFNTVKKSNFVVFHPQLKQRSYQTKRCIFDNKYVKLGSKAYIIYSGVLIPYRAGFSFTEACLNFDGVRPPFGSK